MFIKKPFKIKKGDFEMQSGVIKTCWMQSIYIHRCLSFYYYEMHIYTVFGWPQINKKGNSQANTLALDVEAIK